jgi:hypothetical protein
LDEMTINTKRILASILCIAILTPFNMINAEETPDLSKIRQGLRSVGVGKTTSISLKLRTGQKISGSISAINDDGILINTDKTTSQFVSYRDIVSVRAENDQTETEFRYPNKNNKAVILVFTAVGVVLFSWFAATRWKT